MTTTFREAVVEDLATARNRLSQVENRVNDLQGRPPGNDELRDLTDIQVKFDDHYRGIECGGSPPPLRGESPSSYRTRLLSGLQPFSEKHAKLDVARIGRLDSAALTAIEGEILKDVQRVIDDPTQPSFKNPD